MNTRGQVGVGTLVVLAVTLIVGVVLFQGAAQNIGGVVNTVTVANKSLTATVVNGTAQYLTDYKYITDVVIYNETGDVIIADGNYTVTNNVVYNGQEAVKILPDASAGFKSKWMISGTAQPLTYDNTVGGRSMASLIVLLTALALIAVGAGYAAKSYYD